MRAGALLAFFLVACASSAGGQPVAGSVPPPPEERGDPVPTLRDEMAREIREPKPGSVDKTRNQILDEFKSAYRAIGRARMAVFLNRELSADVREWNVVAGVSGAESESTSRATSEKTEELTEREQSGAVQIHAGPAPDGARPSPAEGWMWEFEAGFVKPFLDARCKLVDRATILRLAATDAAVPGKTHAPQAAKRIEIEALREYADVFIELLVTRSSRSPHGYEFRAIAKQVDDGEVLAMVSSHGRDERRSVRVTGDGYDLVDPSSPPGESEVKATDRGYAIVETPPTVGEASRRLSFALMEKLSYAWQ
jgi:hypothetical protein